MRGLTGRGSIFLLVALIFVPCEVMAERTVSGGRSDRPSIKASALYLIDTKSKRVLLQKNATRRLHPASLTKVMTALVALESASPHQIVHIDRRAVVGRPPHLRLLPGEQFLLRDLLAAMLVTSANDACQAVALHVGGDAPSFIAMMNARARTLGLKDTHFTNACGFDAPDHYSTAADLAKLTEQALQSPAFSMMVRTVERDITTVDGTRHIQLYSTNRLLLDPDVTGVKTGYTSKAGRCLIASLSKDGNHLLLVGLNVMDRWEQAAHLLRYAQTLLQRDGDSDTHEDSSLVPVHVP
jgi:serine-type D-Ala-D-Ala carboxypeptidase (penicillin-binding protein 5/6)